MKALLLMRSMLLFIGLATFVYASCAQPDAPPAEVRATADARPAERSTTTSTRPRIVFLGDSLTAGYGLAKEESVPSLIQARLRDGGYPYEVINAGVSGDTSAGGLSRLDWSLEGDVKVLVIELGANDGLRGLPLQQMRANLASMMTAAQGIHARILLIGMRIPPNYGPAYTHGFEQTYRDLAHQFNATLLPFLLEPIALDRNAFQSDNLHPVAGAEPMLRDHVWTALAPLLK